MSIQRAAVAPAGTVVGRRALGLALLLLFTLAAQTSALRAETAVLKARGRHKAKGGRTAEPPRLLAESLQPPDGDFVAAATKRYLSNDELEAWLKDYEQRCKGIAKLSSIGSSSKSRPIWALEISDKPGQVEAEPAVKYIGNVHGDEPTGRVLTLALAEWLCANHRSDPRAKRIVGSMHLWLVPSMNPDGFDAHTRGNSAGKDLNRDFPDRFASPAMQPSGSEQPETKAMMEWSLKTGFVASASMHEGALVANYPWDGTQDRSTRYEACPDDATFKHLASLYAGAHRRMALPTNAEFPDGGTTNGAAWYPIYGSMQDWNYIVAGCLELTLELSESKWPAEAGLAALWEDNKEALLAFPLAAAFGGLWGTVREEGKLRASKGQELPPVGGANITVVGVDTAVSTREGVGDYYRPLAPGRYTVVVSKPGFKTLTTNLTVPADGSGAQRHFVLAPEGSSGGGDVAFSLRKAKGGGEAGVEAASVGAEGGAADAAGAAAGLPWKGGHRKEGAAGGPGVEATRGRDRLYLLGSGAAVSYGLWVTHIRLNKRQHHRRA